MAEIPTPIVVAIGLDFDISASSAAAVAEIHPDVRFISVPYTEPKELRSARGANGGRLPTGVAAPAIDEAQQAAWREANVAVVWDLPDDIASLAPNLTWIQSVTTGVDKYDLSAIRAAGIRLTNARGLAATSMSEFVLARLLQVWKELRLLDAHQAEHQWRRHHGREIAGRTVGIAGLGSIGRQIAKRLRAFDLQVLATRASALQGQSDPDVDHLFPASQLHEMLAQCDAVVACLPTTDTTLDLFDEQAFASMRPGAVFCNVGRGAQVVETDLIAALETGHIGAAIVDVTRIEPLPADDPLWSAPNLYLSPHASGSLDRYAENLEALILDNLARFVTGDALINEVDLSDF